MAKSEPELLSKIERDNPEVDLFLQDMPITVTDMFRDPLVFKGIHAHIIPKLKTYPLINIRHAVCATREEVYSMAILLEEKGILERSHLYATDFNSHSLHVARQGIYI